MHTLTYIPVWLILWMWIEMVFNACTQARCVVSSMLHGMYDCTIQLSCMQGYLCAVGFFCLYLEMV